MSSFENKWVWITGASSGIGAGMAKAFSAADAHVILSARNEERLQEVASQCTGKGEKHIIPLDLTRMDEFPSKIQKALEISGNIDILFNNGGISQRAKGLDTSSEITRKVFEVNFFGTIELTRQLLPSMLDRKSGHIVTISSVMGMIGTRDRTTYAATKHALHGYFDSLRYEVKDQGIDVTIICPGFIHTNVSLNALDASGNPRNIMDKKSANGLSPEQFAAKAIRVIRKKKKEAYIGKTEVLSIYLKRYAPWLLRRILGKAEVY